MLPYRVLYLAFLGLLTQGNITTALPQGDYQRRGGNLSGSEAFQRVGEQGPGTVLSEHSDGSGTTSGALESRGLVDIDDRYDWEVTKNIYAFENFLLHVCVAGTLCYCIVKGFTYAATASTWQHLSVGAKWTVAKGVVAAKNMKRKAAKKPELDEEAQKKEEERIIKHGDELAAKGMAKADKAAGVIIGAAGLPALDEGESSDSASKGKGHSISTGTQTETGKDERTCSS